MSRYQELISTGIVLAVVTGGAVGAFTGLALDGIVTNRLLLAMTAAFVAVAVATIVRHYTIFASIRGAGPGPGTMLIPGAVLLSTVVASVAGGLGGYVLTTGVLGAAPSVWIGCLSGVLSCTSIELLMIGYRSTLARAR